MDGLYPIIRRVRRPLLPPDAAVNPLPQVAPVAVAKPAVPSGDASATDAKRAKAKPGNAGTGANQGV
jgi:hypothetical protein